MCLSRSIASACVIAATAVVAGCDSNGLSYRESGVRTQGKYLTALYADDPMNVAAERRPMVAPASLAVAQVGEVSPPESMMKALRGDPAVFRRVQAIPAADVAGGSSYGWGRRGYDGDAVEADVARREVNALRGLAAAGGADYLLLVGGTVDQTSRTTPLSVANLTIVGMFIVPSQQTRALMKASGALIDVKTGGVVSLSSAEREETRWFTYASQEGESIEMLGGMRDKVTAQLGKNVIADNRGTEATATAEPAATASRD